MIMPYSLRSVGSGPVPDGSNLRKPTQTIHYCCPLQLLFQKLCWKINSMGPGGCPWISPTPWGLWGLDLSQMFLTSGNQLKTFIIVVLCSFCFNNFAEKSILRTPGAVHDHALLLKVYGVWTCPRWSWPSETNSNHSSSLSFTTVVPTI